MISYDDLIANHSEVVKDADSRLAFTILTAMPYSFELAKEETPYESILFLIAYADTTYKSNTGNDLLDDIADILAETPEPFDKILRESLSLFLAIIDFAATYPGEEITVETAHTLARETLEAGGML